MNSKTQIINSQKNLKLIDRTNNEIITKARFGPSKETRIPLNITEELAFFIAAIIGDGHLKKSKFQTSIELSNSELIQEIQRITNQLFRRDFNIHNVKRRKGRKQSWNIYMDSKALHNFLNQAFEIPIGKKSHIVKVPEIIKNSSKKIKLAFLRGIMATEGGKRRRGYGLSTASKELQEGLSELFHKVGIPTKKDKWIYQKYKKEYYGLVFKKEFYPF
jgi:intein/homing endonuclease